MRSPAVAVYGGGGSPYHHLAAFCAAGYSVSTVFPNEVRQGVLSGFDAFVIPGGGYEGMKGQLHALGEEGADAIATFVQSGGMYLGSCAGAYDAATPAPAFGRVCPPQTHMALSAACVWNEVADPWSDLLSPGVGRVRMRSESRQHPIMAGMPEEFEIVHYNGPLFVGAESLFSVSGATETFTPSEGFLHEEWSSPSMIERAALERASGAVVDRFGKGRVVLFGSHPEFGFSLPMDDLQLPVRMLTNAVQWQVDEGPTPVDVRRGVLSELPEASPEIDRELTMLIARIQRCIAALRERGSEAAWLERRYAMSIFGQTPALLWEESLERLTDLVDEVGTLAHGVRPNLLSFTQPEGSVVDYGYHGILALLRQAEAMMSQALDQWDRKPGPASENPYAFIRTSPYHLVAGSYLSALGRLTSAVILCRWSDSDLNRDGH